MTRMSRGLIVRFLLVLGLLGGCLFLALTEKPTLGLDLKGGAQFVFEAEGTEETPANAENVDKTIVEAPGVTPYLPLNQTRPPAAAIAEPGAAAQAPSAGAGR